MTAGCGLIRTRTKELYLLTNRRCAVAVPGGAGSAVWGMGVGLQPSEGRVRLEPRDTPGNGGWKGGGPRIGVKKG